MINPINLIKIDDIRDSEGKTFHIGQLPEYEQEDYDFSNPKDYERFIRDVKSEVRGSFEYREMVRYLHMYGGMDRSGLNPDISNADGNNIKIEIHHTPFVLEDIVRIVYEKRLFYHEDMSVQMVAKEVMECHYKCIVGLYPLTATEHELVHNGYLFIPPKNVFGRYDLFMEEYDQFIDPEDKETMSEIEGYAQSFDPTEQNKILIESNIYLDPDGAYQIPQLTQLGEAVSNRIDTIRNNMFILPTLNDANISMQNNGNTESNNKGIELIYFLDDGEV